MQYSFKKSTVSKVTFLEVVSPEPILERFDSHDWTTSKAQEIIDGVKASKNGERYEWGNEDVQLASFAEGVFFFDLLARRADKTRKGPDLQLTHEAFIAFMEDLKKFIEKNT